MKKLPILGYIYMIKKSYIYKMKYNTKLRNKIGIYAIICKSTNKMYIGKSKNIYLRFKSHTTALNRKLSKHENQYLINAWKKHGENNFEFKILEFCDYKNLSKRELYYIEKYNTTDKNLGYNLRKDTELGMIPSEETRLKMSKSRRKYLKNRPKEEKEKLRLQSIEYWKNISNEDLEQMKDNLSKSRTRYKWKQYDKNGNFIKKWNSVREILKNNPTYKRHNIYAVASGEKPSIYGFVWKKS